MCLDLVRPPRQQKPGSITRREHRDQDSRPPESIQRETLPIGEREGFPE
jgi:hypothetical protein